MDRLAIFTVLVVSCSAGRLGYNYNYNYNNGHLESYQPNANQVESTKSFYFFAPPDDDVRSPSAAINHVTPTAKKHVQVVVIKAPEYNAYTNAAVDLAKQAVQSKTVIYVLSKEPDLADLDRRFQQIHSTIQKPEVRFVKYRTPEDAKYAEQAIRSQYDNLSGSSSFFNGGAAPVSDFAASPSTSSDDDDELFTAKRPPFLPTGIDVVPGSSYLPPKRD